MLTSICSIIVMTGAIGAPDPAPATPELRESDLVPFSLTLVPGDQRSLRWSPKGRKIEFDEQPDPEVIQRAERAVGRLVDPDTATFTLGHRGVVEPVRLVSARPAEDQPHHERLLVDVNRDGRFDPNDEVFETTAREQRGATWVSFSNIPIDIVTPDGERVRHRFSFWRVTPAPGEALEFDGIRLTRRSWMEGVAEIEGDRYRIALIDANNDGRYTRRDRWVITPDDGTPESSKAAERAVADSGNGAAPIAPCFVGEQAFRLMDVNLAASKASVKMSLDRKPIVVKAPARPKAEAGPTWRDDLDAAHKEAEATGRRVLLKWTAVWCGPCKVMDREAFMDREVVALIDAGFIPVKLDFDAKRAMAREMRINAIPTVHIFTADGAEVARHTGLLEPAAMATWLRTHRDRGSKK